MRFVKLTAGDVRLQWKSGFYGVYAIFTAVYVLALCAVPASARQTVATVMIFTDPAAMGLFFMGALILLEKGQGVNLALAVSPVRPWEYCAAKLLSLALIGIIVALILALTGGIASLASCLFGVLLSSILFSACGLIAAEKSKTLNQFVLLAIPFELLICLPPAVLLFGVDHPALTLHPGVAAVRLISGDAQSTAACLAVLVVWCVPTLFFCVHSVKRHFLEKGGEEV